MSDYDIQPKLEIWAGSPNKCRTFSQSSVKCCMLGWTSFTGECTKTERTGTSKY